MNFEQKASMLFSDLNVPEVFITEHLGAANGDYVKIYLYCLFLWITPSTPSLRTCLFRLRT